jgi:hypothetical protein
MLLDVGSLKCFLSAPLNSLQRVSCFVFLDLCIDNHGSFVIYQSASVRPIHLFDQTSTMIRPSNSLLRERDAPIMWTAIVHLFRAERVPTLRAVTGNFAQF